VVEMKMIIVQNLPYQYVLYTQGVCNASGASTRLFFKTLDCRFFKVWCTASADVHRCVC
jgi:hypothetical protein